MSHSVIFCGTPEFAVPSLQALLDDPAFIVTHVITQPDRPAGRGNALTSPPVKILAEQHGIPVLQPKSLNSEWSVISEQIAKPDFLIVVAYGQILSQEVLEWPTVAAINIHGSLLPRWRGASPIEHAILAGDAETGVSIQVMAQELDAGPVLAMKEVRLKTQDTSVTLRETLSKLGAELLVETLKKPLDPKPQPTEGITFCTKLKKEDGIVNPQTMTAEEIERRVRAFQPWPGVTCEVKGRMVKIVEARLKTQDSTDIELPCANGTMLSISTVQEAGKKPMKAEDWIRGIR